VQRDHTNAGSSARKACGGQAGFRDCFDSKPLRSFPLRLRLRSGGPGDYSDFLHSIIVESKMMRGTSSWCISQLHGARSTVLFSPWMVPEEVSYATSPARLKATFDEKSGVNPQSEVMKPSYQEGTNKLVICPQPRDSISYKMNFNIRRTR